MVALLMVNYSILGSEFVATNPPVAGILPVEVHMSLAVAAGSAAVDTGPWLSDAPVPHGLPVRLPWRSASPIG